MDPELSVGELAKRSGIAPSALRFYEERGLVESFRNLSGHRRYHRSVLRRLAFITFAQRIGLTLDQIAVQLERLPSNRVPNKSDWQALSTAWVAAVDERIAELTVLRNSLTSCIGCGCLSLRRCRLSNPLDEAARTGPGPKEWMQPQRSRR